MEPWQQQVLDEQTALDNRIVGLSQYIDSAEFQRLSSQGAKLFLQQQEAMFSYWDILSARIATWNQTQG